MITAVDVTGNTTGNGAPEEQKPRRPGGLDLDQIPDAMVAVAVGLATALILRTLLDWDGVLGTAVVAYLGFLVVLYVIVREHETGEVALDRLSTTVMWTMGALVVAVLVWVVGYVVVAGSKKLRPGFFTQDLSDVGPLNPDDGGAFHSIIGTLEQVALATMAVVPVAILTAVYLHEIKGRMATAVRFVVDAMSGLPSIVAGLVVYAVWVRHHDYSGIAAAAALAVLMLPTVTRASEEILRTVPDSLREASMALGAPQWKVVASVVLPTARAGLVTASILGVARAIGETAPVILTALGSDTLNSNPLSGAQSNLPLFVWKLYRLPNQTQVDRAWSGALVLVFLVLVLFVIARIVGGRAGRRLKGAGR